MTAITLNLLAEEQHAQEQRAQDPVKLFALLGVGVVATVVVAGVVCSMLVTRKEAQAQALRDRLENFESADAGEIEFQTAKRFADGIVAINQHRWLYAPQIALVKDLVPATIQLANLDFSISKEAGDDGDAGRGKKAERMFLRLDGKATAARPELEVDKFLQVLRADERFKAVVDDIRLRSISRASTGAATLDSAFFVIECQYKEKK